MVGLGQVVEFLLLLVFGRGGVRSRSGGGALLLLAALSGLQLAPAFQVEGDEGPHEFSLQQTDGDEAVDADHLDVEVADIGVETSGRGGEWQSVPEGEDAESDAEQAGDDEQSVVEGKGVLRRRRPLGELEQTGEMADRLDQVLDEQQAQSHASKVEHVGRHGKHCDIWGEGGESWKYILALYGFGILLLLLLV